MTDTQIIVLCIYLSIAILTFVACSVLFIKEGIGDAETLEELKDFLRGDLHNAIFVSAILGAMWIIFIPIKCGSWHGWISEKLAEYLWAKRLNKK